MSFGKQWLWSIRMQAIRGEMQNGKALLITSIAEDSDFDNYFPMRRQAPGLQVPVYVVVDLDPSPGA